MCSPRRSASSPAQRDEIAHEEKRLDDEASSLRDKAAEVEAKMYSGSVSSPRELQAMQADVDQLRRHERNLETRELELMEAREPLDANLAELDTQRSALVTDLDRARASLESAEVAIDQEMAEERKARDAIAGELEPTLVGRLRAPSRARARRRRGAARRDDLPGLPPVDPLDRGGQHPESARGNDLVLRQLRLHPGAVSRDGDLRDEVVIYSDGGARGNPGPAAIGAIVLDPSTSPPTRLATVSERIGSTTNNVAEYQALIAGLEAAREFPSRVVRVRADSMLVIEQLKGKWRVKQDHLRRLHSRALGLLEDYEEVDLAHVPTRAEHRGRRAGQRGARRVTDRTIAALVRRTLGLPRRHDLQEQRGSTTASSPWVRCSR